MRAGRDCWLTRHPDGEWVWLDSDAARKVCTYFTELARAAFMMGLWPVLAPALPGIARQPFLLRRCAVRLREQVLFRQEDPIIGSGAAR